MWRTDSLTREGKQRGMEVIDISVSETEVEMMYVGSRLSEGRSPWQESGQCKMQERVLWMGSLKIGGERLVTYPTR